VSDQVEQTLTPPERLLRLGLRIAAVIFTLETLVYLLPALFGSLQDEWIQLPFVANSAVKAAVVGGACWIAGADVRRFSAVVPVVLIATGGWVLVGLALLIWGEVGHVYSIFGLDVTAGGILWAGVAFEGSLTVLFVWLYRRAERARYRLSYLSPTGFRTLAALADVLVVGDDERISPEEVAQNVDRYLVSFRAHRKWLIKVALLGLQVYPLLTLRPPLSLMAPGERLEFVKKRFLGAVEGRRLGRRRRLFVQAMIRLAQQMVFLGYYSDERTFDSVGYVPFSKRSRFAEAMKRVEHDRPSVKAMVPAEVSGKEISADVVVIGSGAAGAMLAYRLAERGRDVLILERGLHVDPRDFSEDEVEMISKLYADGALQLSRDFRFQILQGMCVGGSTVVNNAVCFKLPEDVLATWNSPQLDAGLDEPDLWRAFDAVHEQLRITAQPEGFLNPGARKFVDGVERLGLNEPGLGFGTVQANIADCVGCGYCNIGCAYGKKLSMLDTVLPEGQARFGDRLKILAECQATRIRSSNGRADVVECKLGDGRELRVRAESVIVSAGAIGSSWLLHRSRLGGRMVGKNLAFNMGSPLTADFDEELRSYDGLQISHFLEPPTGEGYVFETWFNPVVAQALTMPGWFEDHYTNMRRYAHLTAVGVLVGTERNAEIRRALTGGPDIVYEPTEGDLAKLIEALKLAGKIYLAAGAKRVMPTTFHYLEFDSPDELDRLDEYIRDDSDISLGTGHPQGGNALSQDPAKGVVDPDFLVHGMTNLYVCDASVFPTSITVNPQMTTMALAEYAAARITS
jgi:choline dehydrogenase-like flavoprotein